LQTLFSAIAIGINERQNNKERAKELQALKKKYKHWGKAEEAKIKRDFETLVQLEVERAKGVQIAKELIEDFQNSANTLLYSRMKPDHIGEDAWIKIAVPRTLFYGFVYPLLKDIRFWSAHYGDWSQPFYRHRLIGSVRNIKGLRALFGDKFVVPGQAPELSGYNSDLSVGELHGYLLFLNYNRHFKFSVCYL